MKHSIIFVGLDVHKDSITIALADDGRDGEVRLYGSIGGDTGALDIEDLIGSGIECLTFLFFFDILPS